MMGRAALITHSRSWPLQVVARFFIPSGRSPMLVEASTHYLRGPRSDKRVGMWADVASLELSKSLHVTKIGNVQKLGCKTT